jgi:hypothetical protein
MEVSGQLHPQGKSPFCPLYRRPTGPQSQSGRGGEDISKNCSPPTFIMIKLSACQYFSHGKCNLRVKLSLNEDVSFP